MEAEASSVSPEVQDVVILGEEKEHISVAATATMDLFGGKR